jgi:5'-nucleotidase
MMSAAARFVNEHKVDLSNFYPSILRNGCMRRQRIFIVKFPGLATQSLLEEKQLKIRKILVGLTALIKASALPLFLASCGHSGKVNVQILAVNDFHGHLEPPEGSSGRIGTVNAGGGEYLATHIETLRARNPNTVLVSAGDMIGSSPLLSALFHDEPTIEAFNRMGLDFNAVGNHEFDEGMTELLRMDEGGCHPKDGCMDGDGFAGADFQYLAANVVRKENGRPLFPAYKVRSFEGVKIAFIGMTLEGTPTIVSPSGVAGLNFLDEAETVNALVPQLKSQGVKAIVVLIHEGGAQLAPEPYNGCMGISGAIVDIVNRFDPEVDVVISGHTHKAYNCVLGNKLVTSAASYGRLVTDIDLTLDPGTGEIVGMAANNMIVARDVSKDKAITALIEKYKVIALPLARRTVGSITADITHRGNLTGESALGDVIADSLLHATASPNPAAAVVAFTNPGGLRADLLYAPAEGERPGEVNYGEMFTVLPFGDNLVTITLTGVQIKAVLEQQFDNPTPGLNRILQVSKGFTYDWLAAAPIGSKVSNIRLNGVPLDPARSYRVTVNSYLADGGDNFSIFKAGVNRLGGAIDTDAFEDYMKVFSPLAPGPQNRITKR